MRLKPYHGVIAAGVMTIATLLVLRNGAATLPDGRLDDTLQGAGFLLCATGMMVGGRALRERYAAMRFDTSTARRDHDYMLDRQALRLGALPAAAALGALFASRIDIKPWILLALVPIGTLALALVVDRLQGWR